MYEERRGPMWPTIAQGLRECPGNQLAVVKAFRSGCADGLHVVLCSPFFEEEDLDRFFADNPKFSLPFCIVVLSENIDGDAMMKWLGEGNAPEDHPSAVGVLSLEAPGAVGEA